MSKRIAVSSLTASTIDIINTIRANASFSYQQSVPEITSYTQIPAVGEVIYGNPAFSNEFINALLNRIALVQIKSATFNNPYRDLKKGYLEMGEVVEEIFVDIAKVTLFKKEEVSKEEFRRTIPDVKSAFHAVNWRVKYPVTIEDEELRQAFTSVDGVTDMIAKIVDAMYRASEYDEFLLFKYMLIKGYNQNEIKKIELPNGTTMTGYATEFRGLSNEMLFLSNKYNAYPVRNNTPRERQRIFMDARFNARFDVEVLASAFNMDKAEFLSRLTLIDNWDEFDNERFEAIVADSNAIEEVTSAELTAMSSVRAMIIDEDWFQVYDELIKFTETYAGSGLYWNYWLHNWKTISWSPFANAVAITEATA